MTQPDLRAALEAAYTALHECAATFEIYNMKWDGWSLCIRVRKQLEPLILELDKTLSARNSIRPLLEKLIAKERELIRLRGALAEETEACAHVAELCVTGMSCGDWTDGHDSARHQIAEAIRGRIARQALETKQ